MNSFVVVAAAAAMVPLFTASRADACGGLFCGQPTLGQTSVPVDQTAERILFEVNDDGSVTATVEISYAGDPADFSWILPVPATPTDVDVAPASILRLLDRATVPTIIPPPTTCSNAPPPFAGGAADAGAAADSGGFADGGVTVTPLPNAGPYGDIVVVESTDPDALVAWLNDNGYLVTPAMEPAIDAYVLEGQKFLAMKLQPTSAVDDIVPVRFTCPGQAPHIPLRLTALASLPEMSIVAFIAGAGRYRPMSYRDFTVDPALVRWDRRAGRYNYAALVSYLVDEEGGKAFAVERAQSAAVTKQRVDGTFLGTADEQEARAELDAVLGRRAFVTRLYTRMNAEEMDEDPVFLLDAAAPNVSGTLDLSTQPAIDLCGPLPPLCGSTYCGDGASCAATVDGVEGCVCAAGQSARRIPGSNGDTVFCAATATDVLGDVFTGPSDPCAFFSCGQGSCVGVNGAPTCACDAQKAARVDFGVARGVLCVDVAQTTPPATLVDGGTQIDPDPPAPDAGAPDDDDDDPPFPSAPPGAEVGNDGHAISAIPGSDDPPDDVDEEPAGGLPPNLRVQRPGAFCACVAAAPGSSGAAAVVVVVGVVLGRRRRA